YEQAYPQVKSEKVVAESPGKDPPKETKDAPKNLVVKESVSSEQAKEPAKVETNSSTDTLRITASNPRFKHEAGTISFAFDLKNENTKGQSEGFVWVVAEVALASGTITKIAAPSSVVLDTSGEIKNHKQAYRFSIKRFRDREFKLKDPKDAVELK